jgi:hypothetical protein
MTLTIEMKWKQTASIVIAALENGTDEGRKMARAEIMRMADVADFAVDLQREIETLRTTQAEGAGQ